MLIPTVHQVVNIPLAQSQLKALTSALSMSTTCVPSGQPLAALTEKTRGRKRSADLFHALTMKHKARKCEDGLGYIVLQAAIFAARSVLLTQRSEPADPGDALWQAFVFELMHNFKKVAYATALDVCCCYSDSNKTIHEVDAIWQGATRAAMGADDGKNVFWQVMISAAMETEEVTFFKASLKTSRWAGGRLSWQGDISAATATAMLHEFRANQRQGCECDIFKSLPKF